VLVGGDGNDSLAGGNDADDLEGGNSDDTLLGDEANDTLNGGAGLDSLLGGNGDDRFEFADSVEFGADTMVAGGDGDDTIAILTGSSTIDDTDFDFVDSVENLLLASDADHSVTLGLGAEAADVDTVDATAVVTAGNDVLVDATAYTGLGLTFLGGAGADTALGGGGADTLTGGAGDDSLNGGTGADVFNYAALDLNTGDVLSGDADTIGGIEDGELLDITDTFAGALLSDSSITGTAGLDDGEILGTTIDANNNIAFDDTNDLLMIDTNENGTFELGTDFTLQLVGVATVTYNTTGSTFTLDL